MQKHIIYVLIGFAALAFVCCGDRSRMATSEEELQSILAEAFREGDISVIESLIHPSTDQNIKDNMLEIMKPWFEYKPKKVNPSIMQLVDVPIDLPGELNGRRMKYTTSIDGVVFLDGRSSNKHGETKITLYVPFSKTPEGYCIAGLEYDEE